MTVRSCCTMQQTIVGWKGGAYGLLPRVVMQRFGAWPAGPRVVAVGVRQRILEKANGRDGLP